VQATVCTPFFLFVGRKLAGADASGAEALATKESLFAALKRCATQNHTQNHTHNRTPSHIQNHTPNRTQDQIKPHQTAPKNMSS
jgi:hypothetical protein